MRTSVVTAASLFLLFAFTPGCTKQSEAAGRSGTLLALSDPSDQTLTQGGTNKISVSVDRHGFSDAVQVSFSNLPMGVSVDGGSIRAGDSRQDFVLVAAPDAQIVTKHLVTVTVRGSGAAPSQTFELTVKPK